MEPLSDQDLAGFLAYLGAAMSRLGVSLALSLACAALPRVAFANGRFPQAQQLALDPNNPNHVVVQVTYGIIQTWDGGKNWQWSCEDAVGYGTASTLDPPIAVMSDGTLIAGVFNGLAVSSNMGCDYAFAQAPGVATCQSTLTGLAGRYVIDVARQPTDATHAIAMSSNGCGVTTFDTRLWATTDNAKTWTQQGVPLPGSFLALTTDSAPTAPTTIYASGFRVVSATDYRGTIARSTDGGASWVTADIAGSTSTSAPFIAAVDPNDDKTIYVRLASDQGQLLVSHDAGMTFTKVLDTQGKMLGFALSSDGKQVAVGGDTDGVLIANVSDFKFTQVSKIHNRCLTWSGRSLYACASEGLDGFTVGVSIDEGATFTPLYHLSCLAGPVGCPQDSAVSQKCQDPWALVSQTIETNTCMQGTTTGGGPTTGGCCSTKPGAKSTSSATTQAAPFPLLVGVVAFLARRRRAKIRS
jgi:photosystem II stability/assembly factor-like uncharacterized protein